MSFTSPLPRPIRAPSGMALVIVMTALALISFLVLTILTLNRAEERASTNEAQLMDVDTLSGLPSQVVLSQIRRATQNLGTQYTWTSQPGMIRVFDNATPPVAEDGAEAPPPPRNQWYYLLYSGDVLYADNSFDPLDEASQFEGWEDQPSRFVDLNEPIEVRPRTTQGESSTAEPELVYPILDPSALERQGDQLRVEGLQIAESAPGSTDRQPVPMPVQWLYVLSDGKILPPVASTTEGIRIDGSELDEGVEIVGRIAFWTDDESCKINLNTASEPVPWLPPHTTNERDQWFAVSQPANGEWHRQPGHPAFTAVSPVFRSFGETSPNPNLQPQPPPASVNDGGRQQFEEYIESTLALLPSWIEDDTGSDHGTEMTDTTTVVSKRVREPLFHGLDELQFEQSRGVGGERVGNGSQSVGNRELTALDVRRARFFATTRSSAPETNPYNQPKVSLWPVQESETERTRFDQMMRLAATLGGSAGERRHYGLDRAETWTGSGTPGSAWSIGADLDAASTNEELFQWLQEQTRVDVFGPLPGYGLAFDEKYGAENSDSLLLSMFDMLRWNRNTSHHHDELSPEFDYLAPGWRDASTVVGAGQVSPLIRSVGDDSFAGANPKPIHLRGHGRVLSFTEAALVLIATDAEKANGGFKDEDGDGYADRTTKLRAFLVLEPYLDTAGGVAHGPDLLIRLLGMNGGTTGLVNPISIDGIPLRFGDTTDAELVNRLRFNASSSSLPADGRATPFLGGNLTPYTGLAAAFVGPDGSPRTVLDTQDPENEFPWFSAEITLPQPPGDPSAPQGGTPDPNLPQTAQLTCGDLAIVTEIEDQIVQELLLPFSDLTGEIPVPKLHKDDFDLAQQGDIDALLLQRFRWLENPLDPTGPPRMALIRRGDVVRSVELSAAGPSRGDARLLGTRYQVPREWYSPCVSPLPTREVYESHSLREGAYPRVQGQFGHSDGLLADGTLPEPAPRELPLPGRLLPTEATPLPHDFVPPSVQAALTRSNPEAAWPALGPNLLTDPNLRFGDFETGIGSLEDGTWSARIDAANPVSQEAVRKGFTEVGSFFSRGGDAYQDRSGIGTAPYRSNTSAIQFGALNPYSWGRLENLAANAARDPEPWRTLLFCPNPVSRITAASEDPTAFDHPGFASPPDHLWLEFFWNPVVEPRLMSPGFSTEGKINLNYQIFPFTWIERSTGIHAAMRGVLIPALPSEARPVYKAPEGEGPEYHYAVDVERTLDGFRRRFEAGEVFLHASEICELYLAPERIEGRESEYDRNLPGAAEDPGELEIDALNEWWNGSPSNPLAVDAFELTGDNLRESPYAQLYPRLCTRSNVYRVHYRVQLLSKSRTTEPAQWVEGRDRIVAEQRGSAVIERYLDPNDPEIPDLVSDNPQRLALDEFYRYRILSKDPFTP